MSPSSCPDIFLVSSCLAGLCTRYDGQIRPDDGCIDRLKNAIWIPVCPEQLGGLPTPREAADISDGDGNRVLKGRAQVLTKSGIDLTNQFIKGAEQVLKIAQSQKVTAVLLKSKSPSCAVAGTIGVTAALLQKHGFDLQEY
jgi:uncharacterized protein YbbK (DUF523 family)